MTLNTQSNNLQFVKVDGPIEQLIEIYDTSPERCVLGAVSGVMIYKCASQIRTM